MLEHVTGPCKAELRRRSVDSETSLADALIELGVPERERDIVLQELRLRTRSIVKFDALLSISEA